MRTYVTSLSGEVLTVDVPDDAGTTVDAIKVQIWGLVGKPPDQQRLIYAGKQLEDGWLLSDYKIREGANLQMVPRCGMVAPVGRIQICVRLSAGKALALDVEARDTVDDVKAKIKERVGIPVSEQILLSIGKPSENEWHSESTDIIKSFAATVHARAIKAKLLGFSTQEQYLPSEKGRPLEDGRSLSEYDIANGSTLHLLDQRQWRAVSKESVSSQDSKESFSTCSSSGSSKDSAAASAPVGGRMFGRSAMMRRKVRFPSFSFLHKTKSVLCSSHCRW